MVLVRYEGMVTDDTPYIRRPLTAVMDDANNNTSMMQRHTSAQRRHSMASIDPPGNVVYVRGSSLRRSSIGTEASFKLRRSSTKTSFTIASTLVTSASTMELQEERHEGQTELSDDIDYEYNQDLLSQTGTVISELTYSSSSRAEAKITGNAFNRHSPDRSVSRTSRYTMSTCNNPSAIKMENILREMKPIEPGMIISFRSSTCTLLSQCTELPSCSSLTEMEYEAKKRTSQSTCTGETSESKTETSCTASMNSRKTSHDVVPASNSIVEIVSPCIVRPRHKYSLSKSTAQGILALASKKGLVGSVTSMSQEESLYQIDENVTNENSFQLSKKRTLTRFVARLQDYTERECRTIFKRTLARVQLLHNNNVVHSNLHVDNVCLTRTGDVQLRGLQYAKNIDSATDRYHHRYVMAPPSLKTRLYSFTSPETDISDFDSNVTKAVDIWSLGSILFMLLTGSPAFDCDNGELPNATVPNMTSTKLNGSISFNECANIPSIPAQRLILSMLHADPTKRPTIATILASEWMTMDIPRSDGTQQYNLSVVKSLLSAWNARYFSSSCQSVASRRTTSACSSFTTTRVEM